MKKAREEKERVRKMTERGYANIPKRKPLQTSQATLAESQEPSSMTGLVQQQTSMTGLTNGGVPSAGALLR